MHKPRFFLSFLLNHWSANSPCNRWRILWHNFKRFACLVVFNACRLLTFFKINYFKNIQRHQSVKHFVSRPGPTCRSWSGSKLFVKVISSWQKASSAIRELSTDNILKKLYFENSPQTSSMKIYQACKELCSFIGESMSESSTFSKSWTFENQIVKLAIRL